MRAFPVRLPSGQRYWTVLDEDLQVVGVADGFLRHQRFGRDGAESTSKVYAHAIALFLRWCSGRAGAGMSPSPSARQAPEDTDSNLVHVLTRKLREERTARRATVDDLEQRLTAAHGELLRLRRAMEQHGVQA